MKPPSNGPRIDETPNIAEKIAEIFGALLQRVEVGDDGLRHRQQAAGADALHAAEQDQLEHVLREAAQRGTDEEDGHAGR